MRGKGIRLEWSPTGWFKMVTPFEEDFIEAVKNQVKVRAWDPDEKVWWVPARYLPNIKKLIKVYFDQVLDPGVDPTLQVPRGMYSQDYAVLCVLPEAPDEVVRAAYKQLAFMVHPDRGGNPEHMTMLNAAYNRVCKARGL